ncbi:AAA domain-containing protein [Microvirga arabica]|uniref:AAA domain-containing protein n=1 Tax=Microvirga arabica TaxID=1128671 RepID=A0ABV6Y3Z6_9HYPH
MEGAPAGGEGDAPLPDWQTLLGYYAATQRADPRGTIEEFADRHGKVWQLLQPSGCWWADAEVRVGMESLPETLREALARRATRTAAVGWPISLFSGAEGTALVPGLILAANWRIEGADLILDLGDTPPTLNPAWLREVRRNSVWSESALVEQLFPDGEDVDLATVGERMRHALATLGGAVLRPADTAFELSLQGTGLRNAVGFFLPEDGTFTKGAAEDLEVLRAWSPDMLGSTALGAVLGIDSKPGKPADVPVLSPAVLTDSQIEAAESALGRSLTVIQGPPGTGKSQVILSLLLSAVMNGRSVLFAAKNHQAVDEVERRLKEIVPDCPLLTRARDSEGERNTSFLDALGELSRGETRGSGELEDRDAEGRDILQAARNQQATWHRSREIVQLNVALSELTERLEFLGRFLPAEREGKWLSWFHRLLKRLRIREFRRQNLDLIEPLPERAPVSEIERRAEQIRQRLSELKQEAEGQRHLGTIDPTSLGTRLQSFLPRLAKVLTRPSDDEWRHLSDRVREIEFQRVRSVRRMDPEDARAVLRHRPVWAVSTLSAPARIPLIPELFDYVIFDEASQCDIASALPLMARARNAVVVGDPMQLRFVPPLGNAAEHALMDGLGLPRKGRASIAQSTNSLFDFCERRPCASRKFLADQFRSAPPIVDYLNADFYNGRLIGRRAEDAFSPPLGYKPGLAWEDVAGHATRQDGGTVNQAEADQIARLLKRIADDQDFSGTVGVISPFNAQVALLQHTINRTVSQAERDRLSLRVSTVDKFQGGEADVILFSLVLAASAPQSARTFIQRERRRLNVAISRARALCIVVGDLTYARTCGIRHIEFLAQRATMPWSPPRLHQHDSSWERRLDTAMRRRGWDPIPQYPIGTRYLDFALEPEGARLDIEVDGRRWHTDTSGNRKVSDRMRDAELRARGWKVLRFWVHELAEDMEGCVDRIERELRRH